MKSSKFLFIPLLLIALFCNTSLSAPYFTYSGPTTVTVLYNQTSVPATYSFSYYNMGGLYYPCLVVALDGVVISNTLCSNPSTPSSFAITFTPGTHTVSLKLLSVDGVSLDCYYPLIWQEVSFTVTAKFKVREENIFPGGQIYVENLTTSKPAPHDRTSFTGDNFQIGAIDQSSSGYSWIWNTSGTNNSKWEKIRSGYSPAFHSYDRNTTYTVQSNDHKTILRAGLRKICLMDFQNSFIGVGNGGIIKVNSIQYNSPKLDVPVTELNPVTIQALSQVINGIQYTFTQWNDGNTSSIRSIYPPNSDLYTASFTGKPLSFSVMSTHFNDIPGQNVIIYWNDHPNTNVTQYQIWRKVKHNGVTSSPALIATRNRGVNTYTDDEYQITNGYTDDIVYYDVRPYYSTESSYADPYWMSIFGELVPKTSDSTSTAEKIPEEFSVSCFPNPFNPATNIRATLPADGLLQVVIYNVLGQEIIQLKNEIVTKGSYEFIWNGKDSGYNQVNSGIYIVFVKTEDKMISQKIVLLK